eukprot:4541037-Karenia_brevis.AAC.1
MFQRHRSQQQFVCSTCQRPPCRVCGKIPAKTVRHSGRAYICDACSFPPCDVCQETPRPTISKCHVDQQPNWVCASCTASQRSAAYPPCAG